MIQLTDQQWKAFTRVHPQEDFKLCLPEDIEALWGQLQEVLLARDDDLRLPEAEGVRLWDTSDASGCHLMMTVDLTGIRVASLTFMAHNGAHNHGDPVVAARVQPFVFDHDTGEGVLGSDATGNPNAEPVLALFTD
jgi:hypothetical protein